MEPAKCSSVRFEDLGEPVQQLLQTLKGDRFEEDMTLLTDVSAKDMLWIQKEMLAGRNAEEVWQELLVMLKERKGQDVPLEHDPSLKQQNLEAEKLSGEEQEDLEGTGENPKCASAEPAQVEAIVSANLEAADFSCSDSREGGLQSKKTEKKTEDRTQDLQVEQEAAVECANHQEKQQINKKKEWGDYMERHPLAFGKEFSEPVHENVENIAQKDLPRTLNMPPRVSGMLLNRTYTPKCPNCGMRFGQPPPMWECPMCLKSESQRFLVWQPDTDSRVCMICKASIGRWSRHHCRSCGRLVCSNCCSARAWIAGLAYNFPVKVCIECAKHALSARNP